MFSNIVRRMFGIKKIEPDFLVRKKKKKEWVMKLAVKYLRGDIYMFFIESYTSNRTDDNIAAKPIEDYIIRRYEYEQSEGNLERDKSNLRRRRQIDERCEN